jgi:peptidoglycan/LPS O-acetylase OafA/YrhL
MMRWVAYGQDRARGGAKAALPQRRTHRAGQGRLGERPRLVDQLRVGDKSRLPPFVLLCLRSRALAVAAGSVAAAVLAGIPLAAGALEVGAPASPLGMARCAADFTFGLLAWCWQSFLPSPRWLDRALSVAPLYFLGEIPYSLYLTHWPILWAFGMTWWSVILLAVVPILSYRLVEKLAREFGRRSMLRTTQFFGFGRNPIA